MEFRLLGRIEVIHNGHSLALGRRRERLLLALLLLEVGSVVSAERLIARLWDDDPPATARASLHTHVSRLRAALSGGDTTLISHANGYLLAVDPKDVDVYVFQDLVSQARQTADPASRAGRLREALRQWRGPLLADLPHVRDRLGVELTRQRLDAIDLLYASELEVGRHREIIAELGSLVAEHPTNETLTAHLMLALHRAGDRPGALDAFGRLRARLAEELGLDPGQALQELQTAILRDDPTLRLAARQHGPAQLPPNVGNFSGRAQALRDLDEYALQRRGTSTTVLIAAISGTGGVGKTALAVHWAHRRRKRFPDGQLYVNLRGFNPDREVMAPATAIRLLLDALEVPPRRVPADLDAQVNLYRTLMADRRMLVVLDNARDADQVRPLLPGTPGCLVLITSRNQLASLVAAEGAHHLALDLLTGEEARNLLIHRLGIARVTAEPGAVAEIIGACARLPLALSVVAARAAIAKDQPLAVLAGELRTSRNRLDSLSTDDDPHTDVRSVLSWSYHALTPDAARLFRLLGLHPGPDLTAGATASLAASPLPQVRAQLAELTRANLLAEHTPGRYTFHDLLRSYATSLAHTTDTDRQRHAATHRVLDHYLHTASTAERLLQPARDPITLTTAQPGTIPENPTDREQALSWFAAEQAVLLAALDNAAATGFHSHVWRLAWTLNTFLSRRGHWQDDLAAQHAAVAAAKRRADPLEQARAHRIAAGAAIRLGRYDEAHTHLQHALDLTIQADDRIGHAHTHIGLSLMWERRNRLADALEHDRKALDLYRAAGHRYGEAHALNSVGWHYAELSDYRQALTYSQQALALNNELDDRNGQAASWDSLGYAHHHIGNHAQAITCYQHALGLTRDIGNRLYEAETLGHLGDAHHATGDRHNARNAWQQALSILDQLDHPNAGHVRSKLATLDARQ